LIFPAARLRNLSFFLPYPNHTFVWGHLYLLHDKVVMEDIFEVQSMRYKITLLGVLDAAWSEWIQGMTVTNESLDDERSLTTFHVRVDDQAALRGILNRLWDLNLTLVSVISEEIRKENHDERK
jgi:hypothetical protein